MPELIAGGYEWAEYSTGIKIWFDYQNISARISFIGEKPDQYLQCSSIKELLSEVRSIALA